MGDSGVFKNKTDFQTLTRFSYCQCRLRKVGETILNQHDACTRNFKTVCIVENQHTEHHIASTVETSVTNWHWCSWTSFVFCLQQVFGSVFAHFNWSDVTVILDRDHEYSLTVGETLDVGLQLGGYKPNVIKYYSKNNPEYEYILQDASEVSRSRWNCPDDNDIQ